MTTATRSRIAYTVFYIVAVADTREAAEEERDLHAQRNNNDPLSIKYRIVPDVRKEN